MKSKQLTRLERRLGYVFLDKANLVLALTHRSCGSRNNERLEFLGDSIINFVIADILYRNFSEASEGDLSRLRARMVRGVTLAELGREFELGDFIRLGSGELKSGGYRRESILADAVEAIIGAVFIDSGMESCCAVVFGWFKERIAALSTADWQNKDPKTRLQEFLQARQGALPHYRVTDISGNAHDQIFTVTCKVGGVVKDAVGEGSSRRGAEQKAARQALTFLDKES